ncbi:unnamed protein product [Pipistrellus nathusii]|uniref:Uncharacterized protein n=1 Tax=Pipistrellus nathusii TaxID=59473 RepID=A0ABN9ZAG3_PIPNA
MQLPQCLCGTEEQVLVYLPWTRYFPSALDVYHRLGVSSSVGRDGIHSTHRGVKLQSVFNCWHCQAAMHVVVVVGEGILLGKTRPLSGPTAWGSREENSEIHGLCT